MVSLKDKVLFITGSNTGIGKESAYKFAAEGCKIVITYYKDKKKAEDAAKKCLELGSPEVLVSHLDVTDNKSIKKAVKEVLSKFGHVSVLINNAGVLVQKHFSEQTFKEIELQSRTNFEGLVKVTSVCLPHVRDMIINIASATGKKGYPDVATYSGTKFGVRGFTKSLALDIDIPVYAVNPNKTATPMTNFVGRPPSKVAEIILNLAKGKYDKKSGDDVDVWDYIE